MHSNYSILEGLNVKNHTSFFLKRLYYCIPAFIKYSANTYIYIQ